MNRFVKTPTWMVVPGDVLRIGIKHGVGAKQTTIWRQGVVYAVYNNFIVVQLPRYRIAINRWELLDSTVKLQKLALREQEIKHA